MNSGIGGASFGRFGFSSGGASPARQPDVASAIEEQQQTGTVDAGDVAAGCVELEKEAARMVAQFGRFRMSERRARRSEDLGRILDSDAEEKLDELDRLFKGGRFELATFMRGARERFQDSSDLVLALRELRRRRGSDGSEVDGIERAMEVLLNSGEEREIKAGINAALKAQVFGARMQLDPRKLRELYRQFLAFDGPCLLVYEDWIERFGAENRKRILEYIGVALTCDMQSLDPSYSCAAEFGPLIGTLNQTRMLSSADDIFVGQLLADALVRDCKLTEERALATMLGGLQRPFAIAEVMLDVLGDVFQPLALERRSQLLQLILRGFARVPTVLFVDVESRAATIGALEAMIGRVYWRERRQACWRADGG